MKNVTQSSKCREVLHDLGKTFSSAADFLELSSSQCHAPNSLDNHKLLSMVIDRRKAILFASAAAVRTLLFFAFPSLPSLLTGRVEISTPVTSFKRRTSHLFFYPSYLLIIWQYKKAFSSTRIMSPHTMGVSSTKRPCCYRYSH